MAFTVIIPARYASTRLMGKPLLDIAGQPMIYWTWQNAIKSSATRVIIATESFEVQQACLAMGAEVCLTSDRHESGTERIAEVIERLSLPCDEVIVNLQGDEPMLPPALIDQVAHALMGRHDVEMATLSEPITDLDTLFSPHAVKVVTNAQDFAITFSRAPMPWARDAFAEDPKQWPSWPYRRHIGLYAYRAGFVERYVHWPVCELEMIERLEQLRVLWHSEPILVLEALMDAGIGVDTQAQLDKVRVKIAGLLNA